MINRTASSWKGRRDPVLSNQAKWMAKRKIAQTSANGGTAVKVMGFSIPHVGPVKELALTLTLEAICALVGLIWLIFTFTIVIQLRLAAAETRKMVNSLKLDIKAAAESSAKLGRSRMQSQSSRADVFARLKKIDFKIDKMSDTIADQTLQIQKLAEAVASLQSSMEKQAEQQAGLYTQILAIYGTMQTS